MRFRWARSATACRRVECDFAKLAAVDPNALTRTSEAIAGAASGADAASVDKAWDVAAGPGVACVAHAAVVKHPEPARRIRVARACGAGATADAMPGAPRGNAGDERTGAHQVTDKPAVEAGALARAVVEARPFAVARDERRWVAGSRTPTPDAIVPKETLVARRWLVAGVARAPAVAGNGVVAEPMPAALVGAHDAAVQSGVVLEAVALAHERAHHA